MLTLNTLEKMRKANNFEAIPPREPRPVVVVARDISALFESTRIKIRRNRAVRTAAFSTAAGFSKWASRFPTVIREANATVTSVAWDPKCNAFTEDNAWIIRAQDARFLQLVERPNELPLGVWQTSKNRYVASRGGIYIGSSNTVQGAHRFWLQAQHEFYGMLADDYLSRGDTVMHARFSEIAAEFLHHYQQDLELRQFSPSKLDRELLINDFFDNF